MSVSIETSQVPSPIASQQDLCLGSKTRMAEFSLAGKVVCVSGAARGLGLTQAEALLEAGAKVYALDRLEEPVSHTSPTNLSHHHQLTKQHQSPEFWEVQKRAVGELDTQFHYRRIDVRDTELLNAAIEAIANAEGRLDGLVAAAGIQQETPALEYSAKDANTMFEVNVTGVFMTAQAVAKQMIRFGNGGSIALIASMSGTVANRVRYLGCLDLPDDLIPLSFFLCSLPPPPKTPLMSFIHTNKPSTQDLICSAYNASKAAVLQLARNLAAEWGPFNIRVNTISPGYIVTAMVEKLFVQFPDRRDQWPKQNMLGRLSSPNEYRGAAVFLLSDASSFMTGSDLRIDGGHTAW